MVYRLYDDQGRALELYEFSWSKIVNDEIRKLDFDKSGINASLRKPLNARVKEFINGISPYALIYLGNPEYKNRILEGMAQSLCWMTSQDYDAFGQQPPEACDLSKPENIQNARNINYVVFTHSLGSQIAIDGFHRAIPYLEMYRKLHKKHTDTANYVSVKLYMFSNQIPLIQLGRKAPDNAGQIREYCTKDAPHYADRSFSKLEIVAFSDPNDLLSYSLPENNARMNFDSKLCPRSSNVIINVGALNKIFGMEVANPLDAHLRYKTNNRVLAIIKEGVDHKSKEKLKDLQCDWIQTEADF